jgi:hypothetical protein
MSNMIIKRWDTTLNNNAGGWKAISPKVTFLDIVADVTAASPVGIFDSTTNKLKIGYLPDAVFDSLFFQGTVDASGNGIADIIALSNALDAALFSAQNIGRSLKGSYFVVNASGVIINNGTASQAGLSQFAAGSEPYFTYSFKLADAGSTANPSSSGTMEVGDWMVVENVTGAGTSGDPYAVTLAVVNNAYETMSGATSLANGAPGLVPQPLVANELQFLRGDATWATPTNTNTTYSIKAETVTGGADLDLDAGGSGSGTDTISFLGSGATTISRTDANTITVSSANTTYSISAVDHGSDATQKYIRLTDSSSSTDDISITAGSNMSIARNGDQIILAADAYTAGLGLEVSSKAFSMEYPIAVKTTAPAAEYEVSNALWFDIEVL